MYKLNKPQGNVVMVQRNNEWQRFKEHPNHNAAAAHLRALMAGLPARNVGLVAKGKKK